MFLLISTRLLFQKDALRYVHVLIILGYFQTTQNEIFFKFLSLYK